MSPAVIHLSGPAGSGKTAMAKLLINALPAERFYHVRFDIHRHNTPHMLRVVSGDDGREKNFHCYVRPDIVFESFSELVPTIAADPQRAVIIAETDVHPCFRHAYPYDVKIFIFGPPPSIGELFRSENETAHAIDRAMHDTAEFAAELFGLDRVGPQDSAWVPALDSMDQELHAGRQTFDDFLQSPVGAEIAARLRLRPEFQGIVDSDVVFLNCSIRPIMGRLIDYVERIESLLTPLRNRLERQIYFAACDPTDLCDPKSEAGIQRIAEALIEARTSLQ
ncbi:MAG: ATP-binding protein [Phycisphaerae bacterium]|nr:ATP-binding protein [Phycisphaerae bacterium]